MQPKHGVYVPKQKVSIMRAANKYHVNCTAMAHAGRTSDPKFHIISDFFVRTGSRHCRPPLVRSSQPQ